MFSAILSGPIWVEIAASMFGKALITGGLTVIKASPEIKKSGKQYDEYRVQKIREEAIAYAVDQRASRKPTGFSPWVRRAIFLA